MTNTFVSYPDIKATVFYTARIEPLCRVENKDRKQNLWRKRMSCLETCFRQYTKEKELFIKSAS